MSKPPKPRGVVIPESYGGGFLTEDELEALGVDYRLFLKMDKEAQDYIITALLQMMTAGESQVQTDFTEADYRLKPVSMEQFLSDDHYFGAYTKTDLYPKLRSFLIELYDGNKRPPVEIILGGCFTGDTRVAMLDGTSQTFHDLAARAAAGEREFWVYSCAKDGSVVPGRATAPRLTKRDAELVEVTLDDGAIIRCTPDHRFMRPDRSYCAADLLRRGDALMSLHTGKRVAEVQTVTVREDVYDLTVDKYHNFALESGVFVHNSLGWGKSTCAGLGLSYFAYRVACLRNPHSFYRLMSGAKIIIGIYSVSISQAQDTIFGKMINWFDNSPFFQLNMRRDRRWNARISLQGTPMQIVTGSREVHTLGRDMIAFALDEANFINAKNTTAEDQGLAYAIYNGAQKRLKSRFGTSDDSGDVSGQVWLISSKRSKASFLENHVKAVKGDIEKGVTRLLEYARWDVERGLEQMKRFRLEVGDRMNPTRILTPSEPPRPGAQVLQVPEKYRIDFNRDADGALRDLAGLATDSLSPLIGDVRAIDKCVTTEWRHPFRRPTIEISLADRTPIEDHFVVDAMFKVQAGVYLPRRHPMAPRFLHVDIGLTTDPLGISCAHIAGMRQIRRTRQDGTYFDEPCPVVDIDFMLRITPPRGSEIDLGAVRAFIISLRDLGLPIFRVSVDSTYGRDFMQILRKIEFDAVLLSVDRTGDAYLGLRSAIYEERLRFYEYAPFKIELVDLERDISTGKVDHPEVSPTTGLKGTKDVADSVAGAVMLAIIDVDAATAGALPSDPLDDAGVGVRTAHGSVSWSELDRELSKELG